MLVLSRKPNQSVILGSHVKITVLGVRGKSVRLGIEAPREVPIRRHELKPEQNPPRKIGQTQAA